MRTFPGGVYVCQCGVLLSILISVLMSILISICDTYKYPRPSYSTPLEPGVPSWSPRVRRSKKADSDSDLDSKSDSDSNSDSDADSDSDARI